MAMTSFMRSLSLRGGGIMNMTKKLKYVLDHDHDSYGYVTRLSKMTMTLDKIPIPNSISRFQQDLKPDSQPDP
jgi:hypothetical protein